MPRHTELLLLAVFRSLIICYFAHSAHRLPSITHSFFSSSFFPYGDKFECIRHCRKSEEKGSHLQTSHRHIDVCAYYPIFYTIVNLLCRRINTDTHLHENQVTFLSHTVCWFAHLCKTTNVSTQQ